MIITADTFETLENNGWSIGTPVESSTGTYALSIVFQLMDTVLYALDHKGSPIIYVQGGR